MKTDRLISRHLDGEISEKESALLEREMKNDPALVQQARQWQRYGELLRESDVPGMNDPDRAWMDVRRKIRGLEQRDDVKIPLFRPRLAWAGAAAMLLIAVSVLFMRRSADDALPVAVGAGTEVEWVESDLPGAVSMVYADDETGLTVIWVVVDEGDDGHAG
ncbi:MAG: hypothetical protein KJ626_12500 [Verrucomicrobia bacterium]|nr:hypothetical protein [Verrucomicrobiota bacterium]